MSAENAPLTAYDLEAIRTSLSLSGRATDIEQRLLAEAYRAHRVFDAIATINRLHDIGDAVYDVRSRFGGDPVDGVPFTGNSWAHPTVVTYGSAVSVLKIEGVL